MALNEKERAALNKKLEKPESFVECPRCGSPIQYIRRETAIIIKCETEGCIQKTLRGI